MASGAMLESFIVRGISHCKDCVLKLRDSKVSPGWRGLLYSTRWRANMSA